MVTPAATAPLTVPDMLYVGVVATMVVALTDTDFPESLPAASYAETLYE
jgi:hypothetical protein